MNLHTFINLYDNVDIFYISCNSITWILPFFEKNYDRFLVVKYSYMEAFDHRRK